MKEEIKKFVGDFLAKNPLKFGHIPASGKIYDHEELENLIEAALEGWWTDNKWVKEFEGQIKDFFGTKFAISCNSGSSANLLAFSALTSRLLGDRRVLPGDEVITVAAGFPTTVNPILQHGCVPVFLDIDLYTLNIDTTLLEEALTEKTKAVMLAHTLGNPFDLQKIRDFCDKHELWLIEDNCDALGSKYKDKRTGTWGDMGTVSFYPAHHVTTAEGGIVVTDNVKLSKALLSIRDWGRHCWCATGCDNTCNMRFGWKLGTMPEGYDHKFVYSELGYNLKMTDFNGAIGVAQMKKVDKFASKRSENFDYMYKGMQEFEEFFHLPEATEHADPSWFGFTLTIKDSEKLNRRELLEFLTENKIGTRLLFAGNLTRQPYFVNYPERKYRVVGELKNTDYVMNNTFWVGIYQGMNKEKINFVLETFRKYLKDK